MGFLWPVEERELHFFVPRVHAWEKDGMRGVRIVSERERGARPGDSPPDKTNVSMLLGGPNDTTLYAGAIA